jgi:hypothetical protein
MAYIPPAERIPGLEADLKTAREKFEKDPSEANRVEVKKADDALFLANAVIRGVGPIQTYQDHE